MITNTLYFENKNTAFENEFANGFIESLPWNDVFYEIISTTFYDEVQNTNSSIPTIVIYPRSESKLDYDDRRYLFLSLFIDLGYVECAEKKLFESDCHSVVRCMLSNPQLSEAIGQHIDRFVHQI